MKDEVEIINHSKWKYHSFVVDLLYRTPHVHRDYEISILLDGEVNVYGEGEQISCNAGDIWVLNPYQRHELRAGKPALVGVVQVRPGFFAPFSARTRQLFFSLEKICPGDTHYAQIKGTLLRLLKLTPEDDEQGELEASELIIRLFRLLVETVDFQHVSERQRSLDQVQGDRMRKVTAYIAENYSQKLLLSQIAEEEGLSLGYMSHFFKDAFGMPFQVYLNRYRCEKARELLLTTDLTLLDICVSCGFSDIKYMNKYFRIQYGCSPKKYVEQFRRDEFPNQQQSLLSTQTFLSREASQVLLDRYSRNLPKTVPFRKEKQVLEA